MTINQLDLLDSGNFQTYNRKVAKELGSVNAAIMLSELVNRYNYHKDRDELITYKKYEGIWFYYQVEKCTNRTVLSDKEQATALKTLAKFDLFEKRTIGIPGKRHFNLDIPAIIAFITGSKNSSRTAEKAELVTPKEQNSTRRKSATNKEPHRRPLTKNPKEEIIDRSMPPSKEEDKKKFDHTKGLDADQIKLFKHIINLGGSEVKRADPAEVTWWLLKHEKGGTDRVREVLEYYYQENTKNPIGNIGGWMRWALDEDKKPCRENESQNYKYSKDLSSKYDFVETTQKYVKISSNYIPTEQFPYHLNEETFRQRVEAQIEKTKEYQGI